MQFWTMACTLKWEGTNLLYQYLFKHGNKSEPAKLQRINIDNSLSQLFSVRIQKRVADLLEKENILPPSQARFRKKHGTTNQIFTQFSRIMKSAKKGIIYIYICFVDFCKAYDFVNRDLLFKKIQRKTGYAPNSV